MSSLVRKQCSPSELDKIHIFVFPVAYFRYAYAFIRNMIVFLLKNVYFIYCDLSKAAIMGL